MKQRVLVFPCGSEIGLEIFRSLRFSKDFEVFGASSVADHGKFVYKNYVENVPAVDDPGFIEAINGLILQYNINFVIPAHDSVVLRLAAHINELRAKVVTSPVETCAVARSKLTTYKRFAKIVKVPQVFSNPNEVSDYPVFLKPDVGQGSKGTSVAESEADIQRSLARDRSLLILEYLPGREYTVDCFTDRHGNLLFSQARERVRTVNGISVNSVPTRGAQFDHMAEKINTELDFRGVWFFQVKEDNADELALMEISPRVAGTMALCRMQGANLSLLSLYDAMDLDVSMCTNDFDIEIDRALAAKFKLGIEYDTVFVDFDDTIILEDSANYLMIALLYKFRAQGKKVILITKHLKAIEETLVEHKICKSLFHEIIALGRRDKKSDHMAPNAIFIDDSFAERKEARDALGIPVFDIGEAIELL